VLGKRVKYALIPDDSFQVQFDTRWCTPVCNRLVGLKRSKKCSCMHLPCIFHVEALVGYITLWWRSSFPVFGGFPAIRWRCFSTCKASHALITTSTILPGTRLLQPSNPAFHACRWSINNAHSLGSSVGSLIRTGPSPLSIPLFVAVDHRCSFRIHPTCEV
jgi:hypothetical protein